MCAFPRGCCGLASDLLQKYFGEHNIFIRCVYGNYGFGEDGESHIWLETDDHILIDSTGDQYRYHESPIYFAKEVYVGSRTAFHNAFKVYESTMYEVDNDPIGESYLERNKEQAYAAILKRMQFLGQV